MFHNLFIAQNVAPETQIKKNTYFHAYQQNNTFYIGVCFVQGRYALQGSNNFIKVTNANFQKKTFITKNVAPGTKILVFLKYSNIKKFLSVGSYGGTWG